MTTEPRETGISVVGDIPWGTHFCYFYETKQDLLDVLVPYFKVGLENNEFCLWVISNSELLTIQEATGALRKALPDLDRFLAEGSLEVVANDDWFLYGGAFDFRRVANRFKEKVDEALARGYAGMRVNGSPAWLRTKSGKALREFEEAVDELFPHERIIASCTYPLGGSGADFLLDVARNHRFAIARRRGDWEVVETPELKQAKAEIKRLNEELEQRVFERTRELEAANEKLRSEIVERKRAEERIRESQKQYETLVNTIDGIVWEVEAETFRFTFVSKQAERILGYPVRQWHTEPNFWANHLYPDDRDWAVAFCADASQRRVDHQLEYRMLAANGRVVWLRDHVTVNVRDDDSVCLRGVMVDITERKLAEEALRISEQNFRKVFYTSPAPAVIVRLRDRRWLNVNSAFERTFGHTAEEAVGKTGVALGIWPDIGEREEIWQKFLLHKRPMSGYETRLVTKSGALVDVLLYVQYIELSGEDCFLVSVIDITERKRAEEALRESQQLLQLVLATLPVGVIFMDLAGDIVLVNAASKRIWGDIIVSGRQRWGQTKGFWHNSGEMIAPTAWASVRALSEGQTSLNELIDIETYDGQQKTIENSAAPIRSAEGQIVGAVVVNQDVTERVRAEEALRKSENLWRTIFDDAAIGIAIVNPEGRPVETNPAFQKILGYTKEELRHLWFVDFTHPDDTIKEFPLHQEMIDGKRDHYQMEKRYIRKDGQVRWVNLIASVIPAEQPGEFFGVGMVEDITERKRAEEQLTRSNEELRALSARLHSVREEEGARIAREIHDELGGSLSSLKWDMEEIGEIISESADASQLTALREKVAGMIMLTDVTLDAVRRIASELRPTALEEFGLAEALRWHAQQFQARTGISVHCDCPPESANLNREQATAVFRIFQEAMTNVLRHAQATRVDVKMNKEAGHFVLTVSDNGKGITEAEKSGAQSLGLLGMRERAHLLGGEISVEGAEGQGTVVTLRVPAPG